MSTALNLRYAIGILAQLTFGQGATCKRKRDVE
jgi:hypothetical protein